MSVSVEKLEGNKVKVRFEVDAETFEQGMQKAYLKNRGRINVPGFRKGKAPRKLIENMYGEGVFYDDAFDAVFPEVYGKALDDKLFDPVAQPSLQDIEQIGAGQTLIFTAEVYVRPEVTLGQYKGVSAHKHDHPVTDEDVERQVEAAREKQARMIDVEDRPVQDDDIVKLDYAGSVDGVPFQGGTAQDQQLTIGSGQFIPGFEEQLVGLKVGEEKDINVTFPAEYHAEELAGKDAVFHAKINGIQVKELPELDDEFAKDVSEFDTLADYRADIRKKLEDDAAKHVKEAFENDVVDAVVENATVDVPPPMTDREVDRMVREFQMRLMYQGMRMEDFLQYTGQTEEMMREQYRQQAEKRVKTDLVLSSIEDAEGVEATEEEVDAEIQKYADQVQKSLEETKKDLSEEDADYFRNAAKREKTVGMLVDAAVEAKEEKPKKAKAPVKKAAEAEDQESAEAPKKAAKAKTAKTPKAEDSEAAAEEKKAAPKRTRKAKTGEEA